MGLFEKYHIINNEDRSVVFGAFVLRPQRDPHAVAAIRAYADSVAEQDSDLAADLNEWMDGFPFPVKRANDSLEDLRNKYITVNSSDQRHYVLWGKLMDIPADDVMPSGQSLYEQVFEEWLPQHDRDVIEKFQRGQK